MKKQLRELRERGEVGKRRETHKESNDISATSYGAMVYGYMGGGVGER